MHRRECHLKSRATIATLVATAILAALPRAGQAQREPLPPAAIFGSWIDDYGNGFEVDSISFWQKPAAKYAVVSWHPADQFLIARRDPTTADSRTLWLRVDWMKLDGMPPWQWAFCFTAWNALTREAAEKTIPADRSTPRTGCGGYPFSRMRLSEVRARP